MTQRAFTSESVRGSDTGQEERHRLDVALQAATVNSEDLDAARSLLLDRLYRRSDDFAATAALQALNTFSAGQRFDASSDASTRRRDAGRSGRQRKRRARVSDSA
jgi:hypothetical protein